MCDAFSGTVVEGEPLLRCCECPASYHVDCIKTSQNDSITWRCSNCSVGRKPLYGEIVWVKFGTYRWVNKLATLLFSLKVDI